jgi:predicted RNase H-like HicB family nuclease
MLYLSKMAHDWVATALEIPGAFSQGHTIEKARENLLDAIRELLQARSALQG